MTTATAATSSDAAPSSSARLKRPKRPKVPRSHGWTKTTWLRKKGFGVLDHLRRLWVGPDGAIRQPTEYGPTFLDREERVLNLLLLLANYYGRGIKGDAPEGARRDDPAIYREIRLVVSGYKLEFLLERAHMSKSDWQRALDLLWHTAGILSVEGGALTTAEGKVISQINDYVIHVDKLIFWSQNRRPKEWPKAPSRKAGVGPLERAVDEARAALGLRPEQVVEDLQRARRTDRACRQVEAAARRRQKDALALAQKGSALLASDGQVEAVLARVAALRHQAGLDAAPVALFRERASAAVRGAPAPRRSVPLEQLCLPFPEVSGARRDHSEGRPEATGEAVPGAGKPAAPSEVSPVTSAPSAEHRRYSEPAEPVPAAVAPAELGPSSPASTTGDGVAPASPASEPTPATDGAAPTSPADVPSEPSNAELVTFAVEHADHPYCFKIAARRRGGTFLTPGERGTMMAIVVELAARHPAGAPLAGAGPRKTFPDRTLNGQPYARSGSASDCFTRIEALEVEGKNLHTPRLVPRSSGGS